MKRRRVALALLVALAAGAAPAEAADPIAVGRYHLRKANQLAGEDHCHSAIHEYTLAYDKLHDPVVLFNRAECYRRIHQDEKAVADYRAFLEGVPTAPNRADIEARIAALTRSAAPVATAAPPRPNTPSPARPPAPAAHPVAAAPPPPVLMEPEPVAPPPVAAPPPAARPTPVVALAEPASAGANENEGRHGQTTHTWLWIAIGAVVVGGAAGAYIALRSPTTTLPTTELGNYKF